MATATGLSHLTPEPPAPAGPAPPVLLTAVRVDDRILPLPPGGVERLSGVVLDAGHELLVVDFVGLAFGGDAPTYLYSVERGGAGHPAPTGDRSLVFSHLPAGSYRLAIWAVSPEGVPSSEPATLSFRVLPPFWLRWWFLGLVALVLAVTLTAILQARRRRTRALAAIRLQIAGDLHDEMGAGLAQVAILSEVVRRDRSAARDSTLAEIAALARSLRESMGDIVWAIDPRRDRFSHLISRMRQVAVNLLEGAGVTVEFEGPRPPAGRHPRAVGGGAPMSPEIARKVVTTFRRLPPPASEESGLSARELEVLNLLAQGHSYKTAAAALDLRLDTIRFHIRRIYEKLHVHSKSEAVVKALRAGLVG